MLIDIEKLETYRSIEILDELIRIFETEVPSYIRALRTAIGDSDQNQIKFLAHCLLSKAKTIGAIKMTDFCIEMDAQVRSGQVPTSEAGLNFMESIFKETLLELKSWQKAER